MIESKPLEYAGHGDRTSARMAVADLDRDAAAVGQSDCIGRLRTSLCDQAWNGTMQVQLVTPCAGDVLRMVADRCGDATLGTLGCTCDAPEGARQRIERDG